MTNLMLRHRCLAFRTDGQIVYDPDRKGMKNNTQHWAIINVDDEISAYYRYLFEKQFHITLDKPSWASHLSVLKNYTDMDKSIPWNYRDREIVEVVYGHELFWNEDHVWINCYSEAVDDLRNHYSIRSLYDTGHITIGRFNKKDINRLEPFKRYQE